MNSTPSRCSSIMRLTALPPPPPTPTTFMRALCVALSSNSKIIESEAPVLRLVGTEPRGEDDWSVFRSGLRGGRSCHRQGKTPGQYNAFSAREKLFSFRLTRHRAKNHDE